MKIVGPTIVRPWRERIDAASTVADTRALLDELCAFRVLDPSCGCGNFLYVAYRELRGLEFELKQKIAALAAAGDTPAPSLAGVYYPLSNIYGIDIENIAVLIARVTLWMGHRQMVDRYGEAEPVLPLLKGDLRYTPTTVFATFPWPDPVSETSRQKVAAAASTLCERRSELCLEHNLGLTKLYNLMDEGGFADLRTLHKTLDVAVAEAYGWPASVAQDATELVKLLTERNREISTGERSYAPFGN